MGCVPELVLESVVVATTESCEEVLVVVHGRDVSDVNLTKAGISCTCKNGIDLQRVHGRYVHSPHSHTSRDTPNVYHVHRKIDTMLDTSTTTRYKVGGVRTRSIYSVVLRQSATNHVLV